MFPGISGGGRVAPPVVASGAVVVDLSTWTVDVDPDSIVNTITDTTITLNKSGTSVINSGAWARLSTPVTIGANQAILIKLTRTGVTAATKAFIAAGLYDSVGGNLLAPGISAHGTSVSQIFDIVDTTWTANTATAEDGCLSLFRADSAGSTVRQMQADFFTAGAWSQGRTFGSAALITQSMRLAVVLAINDTSGGTISFDYTLAYTVIDL